MNLYFRFFSIVLFLSTILSLESTGQDTQTTFSGKLVERNTNTEIPFALLYIDGTTIATTTDANGYFKFSIAKFPCQVEISHLSYQSLSISLQAPMRDTIITMDPKQIQLGEVTIHRKSLRKEYIKKFVEGFCGVDYWGLQANLLNEDALIFNVNDTIFRVTSSEPLKVELPKLGYVVQVDLREFVIQKNHHYLVDTWQFYAKFYFQSLSDEGKKNKFSKNRLKAYYNSPHHFYKSLYNETLEKNGYRTYVGIVDKLTQKMIYTQVSLDSALTEIDRHQRFINHGNREFYIFYHENRKGFPLDLNTHPPNNVYRQSTIYFERDSIPILSDGTTPSTAIIFSGSIGEKRVGAMLPSNYEPVLK